MAETLTKLRPDRDLQCYFERPSAVAALSETTATGFTVSGTWRQQFDWAVIEWNRENVFEHPAFRNLPDGDLSGLRLVYEETRENCIPMDSTLFPTVDWPTLRVWMDVDGTEQLFWVPVKDHATPVEGGYTPAQATFELHLEGSTGADDYIELAWSGEHHTYQLGASDTAETAVQALADIISANSSTVVASRDQSRITLTWLGTGQTLETTEEGANGNRVGVYGNVKGSGAWTPGWQRFSGGVSPSRWRVELDFGSLIKDDEGNVIPMQSVRKMRWTYSADLQHGAFERSEFKVVVSDWAVTGTGLAYQVAGPGSRRIEDDSPDIVYTGEWVSPAFRNNFSGGSIRHSVKHGAGFTCRYTHPFDHVLYLGTRRAFSCGNVEVVVDGGAATTYNLHLSGEDFLVRLPIGTLAGGREHSVQVTNTADDGVFFYFDFLEIAMPAGGLPVFAANAVTTLATDWDTDHSIVLPPERTAWMIESLGFRGRANHYVGALWFYELVREGHEYAKATVEFNGTPLFAAGELTELSISMRDSTDEPARIQHLHLVGDTAESIAKAFELEINNGYTAIWAHAEGSVLTVQARAMGVAGNNIKLEARVISPNDSGFSVAVSQDALSGGTDGDWRTDLESIPRLNRAVRDWTRSYLKALKSYGIEVTAAFSMELQHGNPSPEAGIAQRYSDSLPCLLNTPALQTNFSPTSLAYWRQVYLEMADLMAEAEHPPYLQFGEMQWWYFPNRWDSTQGAWVAASSMPFYDQYTMERFRQTYDREMHTIANASELPSLHPEECSFLPALIGEFSLAVMSFVRQTHSQTRFEVLYPPDVNDSPLGKVINLPAAWNSSNLDCMKTENFSFTYGRNLNQARDSVLLPMELGFPRSKSSHLVGIGEYTTPWLKEYRLALAEGVESVVLFALDQFCLIGYKMPLSRGLRRSAYMG